MNKLNRILLGALAVQIILILVLQLRGEDTGIGGLEPIVSGFDKSKVERIRIFERTSKDEDAPPEEQEQKGTTGENAAVDMVKKGDTWTMASHFDYPVDVEKVNDLLGKVEGMRSRGPIASGKARQRQLEVADDYYERKVILTAGGADTTFFIGASAGSRQTSVRMAGSDAVHGVTGLTAFGVGARASAWVPGAYLDVEPDRVTAVDLVNAAGTFHFERTGSEPGAPWKVTIDGQPLVPPAGMEINTLELEKVVGRTSKIFLMEPADPKRVIDKPAATFTVHVKAAPEPAGGDAGAVSTPEAETHVIEVATSDKKDRYYLREKGKPNAALVDSVAVVDLVQLTREKIIQKVDANKPPDPGPHGLPADLPPGLDPNQPVRP